MTNHRQIEYLTNRWDEGDGYRIFSRCCDTAGAEKPAVVLVHGLSMSSLCMVPTALRLAGHYRVYAPDLPGYGRSQQPQQRLRRALTIEQLARALEDWMDAMGIRTAFFVANSMGCQIVTEVARQNAGRVSKAVLIGPSIDPSGRSYKRQMVRGAHQLLYEPLRFWGLALFDYLRHGIRHTFQSLGYAMRDPMREKLLEVQQPMLVVRGGRDTIVSQPWAEEVARRLPRGSLKVIPRAGHVLNFGAPDALVEVVLPFFGSCSGGKAA